MYCTRCGAKLADGDVGNPDCPACRAALPASSPAAPAWKGRRSRLAAIVIVVAALAVLWPVLFSLFRFKTAPSSPEVPAPAAAEAGSHSDTILDLEFSADGSRVFSASVDGTARIWDTKTGQRLAQVTVAADCPKADSIACAVSAAAFSPDRSRVILIQRQGDGKGEDVQILRMQDGHLIWRMPVGREGVSGSHDTASICAFSADGAKVAWGTYGGGSHAHALELWDADLGRKLGEQDSARGVLSLQFSPDGSMLAAVDEIASAGRTSLVVRETGSGKVLYQLENGADFRFSRDGAKMLVKLKEPDKEQLEIVEAATGRVLSSFRPDDKIAAFDLSPDASVVITGSDRGAAALWDSASGRLLRRLEPHPGRIDTVRFSQSGSLALASGVDHAVRIWNTTDGNLIRTLDGPRASIERALFSPDDSHVAASTEEYSILIWEVPTGQSVGAR